MTDTSNPPIRETVATDAAGASALTRPAHSPNSSRLVGPLPEANDGVEIGNHKARVVDEAGAVISALFFDAEDDPIPLFNVATSPDRPGRGLGRRLAEKAKHETFAQSFGKLRIFTHADTTESVDPYARPG